MAYWTVNPSEDVSAGFPTIVPSSPTTHFDKVDEGVPTYDGDTSYIRTTLLDKTDRYKMHSDAPPIDLGASAVAIIQCRIVLRATDTLGVLAVSLKLWSKGVQRGSTQKFTPTLGASYNTYTVYFFPSPGMTLEEVNDMELEVISDLI